MRVLTMKQQASARSFCVPEMCRKCMGRKSLPEGMIWKSLRAGFYFYGFKPDAEPMNDRMN